MVIILTGASHTGKTLLAQRMLEKHKIPYFSIDHLKMGLIRSGNTPLTPSDDEEMTTFIWPIVREMIKTAIENKQSLIVEGCYIPYDWRKDFEEEYLRDIRFFCLAMTEEYIDTHFHEIRKHASDIESRLDDSDCTVDWIKENNNRFIEGFEKTGEFIDLIDADYEQVIEKVLLLIPDSIRKMIAGKKYETNDIGMSGSKGLIFDDCVLKILEFYAGDNKEHWLNEIEKSDWRAGKYLYELLRDQKLKELCGESTKVLLLVEGEKLIAFCTYAEQDEIQDASLSPWVGFVYTFPEYRGKRRAGKLLQYAYSLAKKEGHKHIYISTGETGLYEKYGYTFWKMMKDINGDDSRVYKTDIVSMDYSEVLGTSVSGTIDRPLGSGHPKHPEMIYPINYGYVDGVFAGDGAEQDVYVFGTDKPLKTYTGKVIAVYHRLNDVEDKWIVSLNGESIPPEDILDAINFQEQYYMGELYTL